MFVFSANILSRILKIKLASMFMLITSFLIILWANSDFLQGVCSLGKRKSESMFTGCLPFEERANEDLSWSALLPLTEAQLFVFLFVFLIWEFLTTILFFYQVSLPMVLPLPDLFAFSAQPWAAQASGTFRLYCVFSKPSETNANTSLTRKYY